MPVVDRLVIVGVGLIGGSIGMAALQRGIAREVIGVARNESTLREAERLSAITRGTSDLAAACSHAELVMVCTPVDAIARLVRDAAAVCSAGTLISDAGSTKLQIIAAIPRPLPNGVRFVGGHPLAGSEKGGVRHARADLFEGRTSVITPVDEGDDTTRLRAFWEGLGATVREMTADEHDRAVAATSHVPHLAAAALAVATDERVLPLVASGWIDTTRVAAMDAAVWEPIFASNRTAVLAALDAFELSLGQLRTAIETGDSATLAKLLAVARARREAAQAVGALTVEKD
jgi:prephenate dehydrogenase